MSSKRLRYTVLFLSALFLTTPFITVHFSNGAVEPIANLVLRTNGGGVFPDYGWGIAQCLSRIGIEVEVKISEWTEFIGVLCTTHDYDLAITEIVFPPDDFDPFSHFYSKNNNLYYSLGSSIDQIPYVAECDFLLKQISQTSDIENRTKLIYEWQNILMDKIVPFLPLLSSNDYIVTWDNLMEFNSSWNLSENLPYIYFDGLHEGQESLNELILADNNWRSLNPLCIVDESSSFVSTLVNEPLIKLSPEGIPLKYGLINNWEIINESHYVFTLRDDIFWNPSYNVTERDVDSDSLNPATSNLMEGLKDGQTSNGTNRQITSIDAIFTLLSYGNEMVSEHANNFLWMKDIFLDPMDNLSFHLIIDGNETSAELDPFYPLFNRLNIPLLPEFFLNSTSTDITNTTSNIPMFGLYEGIEKTPEWVDYSASPFGCGKYLIDYYVKNSLTQLRFSPYWFGVGGIDGTSQNLNIESILIKIITDTYDLYYGFKDGDFDIFNSIGFFSSLSDNPSFNSYQIKSNKISVLFFNLWRPFIGGADNHVYYDYEGKENYTLASGIRKAICYAIDREGMNDMMHGGNLSVSNYPIPEIHSNYHSPDIVKYSYDLDKSLDWLRPGYTPNPLDEVLETLLILGGGFILISATPVFFLTKGLLDYRKLKRKPSETSL